MKKRLTNNLLWKIFSVFCATILWLVVINIQNPEEILTIQNIEVKTINTNIVDENNLVITKKDKEFIDVKFIGSRLSLEKLRKRKNDINAQIDMSFYTKVGVDSPNPMPVKIEIPLQFKDVVRVYEKNPEYIQVTLEQNTEQSKKVELEIKNQVKEGYEIVKDKIRLNPSEIVIDGSATAINAISKVKATIDVGDNYKSIKTNVPIKFYDVNGKEITRISANANVTNVEIPILKKKTLTYSVQTINNLDSNLKLEGITLSPNEILILGSEQDIDVIDSQISIPVDLADINESKAIKYEIKLPEDVINMQGVNFITINVNVSKK